MSLTAIPKTVSDQLKLVKSNAGGADALSIVRMDTVEAEPIDWLWKPFIAPRKLTGMTGEEGIGKSWITCALASIVSHGGYFPNTEKITTEPGNVLILASEDGLADTLKPRLNAVNADQTKVFSVTSHFAFDEIGLMRFYNLIGEIRPSLVIIDPFFSYLKGGLNINLSTEIRPITSRLAEIAEEFNSAFLLVRHIGKSKGMGDARSAGLGSIDFRAVCRSEILVGKHPEIEREGAIVQIKNNLDEFGKSVGYKIEDGQIFFKETDLTAEKILSAAKSSDDKAEQVEAVSFLREMFRSQNELLATDIIREAGKIGITEKMLRTARNKIGVEAFRRGNSFVGGGQKWYWRLEEKSGETAENA